MDQLKIISGKISGAHKVVIYGPEGIGKSTLASHFPRPLYIDTEGSTKHLDVNRTERPTSWAMLMEQVRYVRNNPSVCSTLIIDTADWAEQLCISDVCAKRKVSGIEDFSYQERFQEGEFRKRVQFMYGGKLQRIRFKYTGPSIEAVLDRLPTAEIVEQTGDGWIVKAEVFGKGVDMWLKSQGNFIQVMEE